MGPLPKNTIMVQASWRVRRLGLHVDFGYDMVVRVPWSQCAHATLIVPQNASIWDPYTLDKGSVVHVTLARGGLTTASCGMGYRTIMATCPCSASLLPCISNTSMAVRMCVRMCSYMAKWSTDDNTVWYRTLHTIRRA